MGTIETVTRAYLQNIADAIRRKSGTMPADDGDVTIANLPSDMQSQIREALPSARNTLNSFNPSSYTHIYNTSVNYGTISNITSRVDSYTTYTPSSYNEYIGEEQIGMYYGLESSSEMEVSVAVFAFGRYSGQNKTLIATLEYKDSNGTWHELDDFEITTTISNPTYVAVSLPSGVYGVRWNHKKEPKKSSSNNLFFYSMWLFTLPHSGEEQVKYYPSQMASAIMSIPTGGGGGGVLSGETIPDASLGSDGDFYIKYQVGIEVELVPHLTADSNDVLASDVFSGYPKWKAFDGTNVNSYDSWAAMRGSIANHYIGYNFGNPTTVISLMVENRNEGSSRAFRNFTLQGSNDLSTWVDIESFEITSSAANYNSHFTLTNPATYNAFRLYITSYYDYSYVGAGIVQFYELSPTAIVFKALYNKQNGSWIEVEENTEIII